jgi:hypothetical protein
MDKKAKAGTVTPQKRARFSNGGTKTATAQRQGRGSPWSSEDIGAAF